MRQYDVIILGAGAAGLFCALTAGQRGKRVVVLEHNQQPGKKILISGGGRCNFTNIGATYENYLSGSPDFCRSALARYRPADFLALVESHGIRWHEKKLGQLFCDLSSRQIVALLLEECRRAGVEIVCDVRVDEVVKPLHYEVRTTKGSMTSPTLVVATGGLSFPKLGASDLGYRLARQFGLRLTEIRPGLVPLTLDQAALQRYGPLSGLSLPVTICHRGKTFSEAMLLTHRGLSGPAVLQISNYWREGETISIDLLPEDVHIPQPGRGTAEAQLAAVWPKRFAEVWSKENLPRAKPVAQWSAQERARAQNLLHAWPVACSGTEGYPKAEVTLGGVDTRELSSKTMESRLVPGLFFIGEVVDVTGWLGGYNFQWAWASAHAAGSAV
jgi:predicted Rossmann fold flavoprotein